jgi:hypothetical protein
VKYVLVAAAMAAVLGGIGIGGAAAEPERDTDVCVLDVPDC